MAVYTFIDKHDLIGKTVISFCTSGGSPISESTSELKKVLPKSKFIEGVRFSQNDISAAEKWVKDMGF